MAGPIALKVAGSQSSSGGGGGSAIWGDITGTLSDQTDLQNALDAKADVTELEGYVQRFEAASVPESADWTGITLFKGAEFLNTLTDFYYKCTNPAAPSSAASWLPLPKVYRALLTQTGTDAPTATVLENSLGGTVVWTRTNTGEFTATLASAFTADKTFIPEPSVDAALIADSEVKMAAGWISANAVVFISQNSDGTNVDNLGRGYITIQVYP